MRWQRPPHLPGWIRRAARNRWLILAVLFVLSFFVFRASLVYLGTAILNRGAPEKEATDEGSPPPVTITPSSAAPGDAQSDPHSAASPDSPGVHVTVEPPLAGDSSGGSEEKSSPAAPDEAPDGLPATTEGSHQRPVTGEVIQAFGWSYSTTLDEWVYHPGVDIQCPEGSPVLAASSGRVLEVRDDGKMGFTVTVAVSQEERHLYAGLQPSSLSPGQDIEAGTVLGKVGPSPLAESALAPHLHFEIRVNGEPVDPVSKID